MLDLVRFVRRVVRTTVVAGAVFMMANAVPVLTVPAVVLTLVVWSN